MKYPEITYLSNWANGGNYSKAATIRGNTVSFLTNTIQPNDFCLTFGEKEGRVCVAAVLIDFLHSLYFLASALKKKMTEILTKVVQTCFVLFNSHS